MHLFLHADLSRHAALTGVDVSCARASVVCGLLLGTITIIYVLGKPQKLSPKKSVTSSEPEQGSFVFPNGEKYGQ